MKRNSLLGYIGDILLRLGLLSVLAFSAISIAVEMERRGRSSTSWSPSTPHAVPAAYDAVDVEQLLDDLRGPYTAPARLRGYPAPSDALGLVEYLALSPEQVAELEAISARIELAEKELGLEIIRLESELDKALAKRELSIDDLHEQSAEIGRLHGKLRATQLEGHLLVTSILSPEQLEQYLRLPEPTTLECD